MGPCLAVVPSRANAQAVDQRLDLRELAALGPRPALHPIITVAARPIRTLRLGMGLRGVTDDLFHPGQRSHRPGMARGTVFIIGHEHDLVEPGPEGGIVKGAGPVVAPVVATFAGTEAVTRYPGGRRAWDNSRTKAV